MITVTLCSRRCAFAVAALLVSTLGAAAVTSQSIPVAPAAVDIRDIRGPEPFTSPWSVPLVAMTVLLFLGGSYGAWAWNRRRVRQTRQGPLEIALQRLAKARELMTPQLGREFSIELSSAVRDYIESRFDVRATHLTTHEFLYQLLQPADALLTVHRSLLDNFLQTCDLAKFGGWNLVPADMEDMLESARRFVMESAGEAGSHPVQPTATAAMDHPQTSASREPYVSLPTT